ncbi:unnamed protein product [Vitrella brassicaformis CCMP3155]|uniref:Uncharacterized protein n=1 Tax=Vitrella brassicaformis (strain CCMP3155) TaxID=1169540 RepID=A0A0G4H1B2_VITBC|nr:unnamed protein product [Vitrella brassicaformis CCMP3155]|mmetsp:Transcript_29841/g.86567  ORF Transcript_29841/g.86567 Transcript_29841/m.86567 type:complete len:445 (-) Transcript_29841:562-1896(-)|eukprot:CEM37207.1 unnamed protein product [Vitrella brassicaformis CCMP3155]
MSFADHWVSFESSCKANLQVLLLAVVGFLCGYYPTEEPFIDTRAAKKLSRIALYVFLPCLCFCSIGSRLTLDDMATLWPLIMWSFLQTVIGWVTSQVLCWLLRDVIDRPSLSKEERRAVGPSLIYSLLPLAVTWQNSGVFPLVMMEAICEQYPTAHFSQHTHPHYTTDAGEDVIMEDPVTSCFDDAAMFVFVYGVGWGISFWSVGYSKLKSARDQVLRREPSKTRIEAAMRVAEDLFNPAIIALLVGILVGCLPAVQSFIFQTNGGFVSSFTKTAHVLGQPTVAVMTMLMAASLAHNVRSMQEAATGDKTGESLANAPLAGSKDIIAADDIGEPEAPNWRMVTLAVMLKLCIQPLIGILLMCGAERYFGPSSVFLPNKPLVKVVILVEFAAPSAQTLVLAAQRLSMSRLAGNLTYIYTWMYIFSFLFATVFCSVAIEMFLQHAK